MPDITIQDLATVVENSIVTDDQQEHERFIQWLWDELTMEKLQEICSGIHGIGKHFEKFTTQNHD